MVAACYAALFFNVNATIGSFVLVDNLRDVGQEAALLDAQGWLEHMKRAATFGGNSSRLLVEYGVSHLWRFALVHCESNMSQLELSTDSMFCTRVSFLLLGYPKFSRVCIDVRHAG